MAWIAGICIVAYGIHLAIMAEVAYQHEFKEKWYGKVVTNKIGEKGIVIGRLSDRYEVRVEGGKVVWWRDYEVKEIE